MCASTLYMFAFQVAQSESILRRLLNIDILSSPVAGSPHGSPAKGTSL